MIQQEKNMPHLIYSLLSDGAYHNHYSLGNQERGIAIAQEAEVVRQGIVVNLVPIALDKGTHEQQQCRLRLMEVGDQHLHNLIVIARSNDNLRTRMQYLKTADIHPCGQTSQCLNSRNITRVVIGFPLTYVKLFFRQISIPHHLHSHII